MTDLDRQEPDDIVGALGTVSQTESTRPRSRRRRLRLLLAIVGPGLIVMGGGNDAGGVQIYAQMGQTYGMKLLWTLVLLAPILYVNQEMVIRLGAVSGVGHARLIFARFGKFWGAFSVIDLFVINVATIIADFIGIELALSYFGLSDTVAVGASTVLLFVAMIGGTFRFWERFMVFLVALNILTYPMAFLVGPRVGDTLGGIVPTLPGGINAGLLLLVVAVVGTTVEPWQLFFQQSSVVDKRITPRWIRYSRMDLAGGIAIEMIGAVVLMAVTAFGLAHTGAFGSFDDLGTTAHQLDHYVGRGIGGLLALVTLDGSLIGANLVGLTSSYAFGDVFSSVRTSLHRKPRQAPLFYGLYAALLIGCAAIVLSVGDFLGVITDYVEALNGVLLPSAVVFLVLLANDKAVLGPWTNTARQNAVAGVIVWTVTTFSLAPLVTTFFPDVSVPQIVLTLAVCALLGAVIGVVLWLRRPSRGTPVTDSPEDNRRPPGMDRHRWHDVLTERRDTWRTPSLETLPRPPLSPARRIGLLTLRAYLVLGVIVLVAKLIDVIFAHGSFSTGRG